MGMAGELCAREYQISREEQDAYAAESDKRALNARDSGYFKDEIAEIKVKDRRGAVSVVAEDEELNRVNFEKIPNLRPDFEKDRTITAASINCNNNGDTAVVLYSYCND